MQSLDVTILHSCPWTQWRTAECSEATTRVFWMKNWILRSTSFKITDSDTWKYNTRVLKILYAWAAIVNSPGATQNLRTPLPIDAIECSIVTSYCFAIHYSTTRVYTASVDIVVAVSVCYIEAVDCKPFLLFPSRCRTSVYCELS